MRISASRYELRRPDGGSRRGALLRVEFPEGLVGYADCHPWTERGDDPLDVQLERLARREATPLARGALAFAREDAEARAAGRSLGAGLAAPDSHYLLPPGAGWEGCEGRIDAALAEGFRAVKIKMRPPVEAETRQLASLARRFRSVRFRLDFGSTLDGPGLRRFVDLLGEDASCVDFIEDPTPWDPRRGFPESGVRLALDNGSPGPDPPERLPDVVILKPAAGDPEGIAARAAAWARPLVVTSYLDHPLGQVCAAWVAARLARERPGRVELCGLLSHRAYERNEFSERLAERGPRFTFPEGPGFGFGDLLAARRWEPLAGREGRP